MNPATSLTGWVSERFSISATMLRSSGVRGGIKAKRPGRKLLNCCAKLAPNRLFQHLPRVLKHGMNMRKRSRKVW